MFALIDGGLTLTSTELAPIVDAITTNVPVIMTAGLGIMAVTVVIGLVPKFLKKFIR